MAAYQDPTPCPAPRLNSTYNSHRASSLEPSNRNAILPGYSKSFRDAQPRRPRAIRQSLGWDPTIDIYDDTFAFQAPRVNLMPTKDSVTAQHDGFNNRRSSSIFNRPPQRPTPDLASSNANGHVSPKRKRMSTAPQARTDRAVDATARELSDVRHGPGPTLLRNPRRRTIYIPSEDTTIASIHPGKDNRHRECGSSNARQSDVFLDMANITNVDAQNGHVRIPLLNEQSQRSTSRRQSLAAAPKRVPLQQSSSHTQNSVYGADVEGSGGGKENVPPGGIREVKRSGKRASLMFPQRLARNTVPNLETLQEHSPSFVSAEVSPSTAHSTDCKLVDQEAASLHPQKHETNSTIPPKPINGPKGVRQAQLSGSMTTASVTRPQSSASQRHRPTKGLGIPKRSINSRQSQVFPVITEHIEYSELYEDDWLSHQEIVMTHLINDLFNKFRLDEGLRTKSKADSRADLLSVYQDKDILLLYRRLQASLQFGALTIPTDTLDQVARFQSDFGQQQRFLDLWLKTYKLQSLEVALETVVGRQIAKGSGASECRSPRSIHTKPIASFLKSFLIKHQDAKSELGVRTASGTQSTSMGLNEQIGVAWQWRRTVLRSLMLILLLDRGQEAKLLGGCLFQVTSPYKSSMAVLQGLCRLLVPSIGDVSRVLSHLTYTVTYVQTPLDEFQFSIGNIATDLRDGIRLTKLVETLVHPTDQTTQLDQVSASNAAQDGLPSITGSSCAERSLSLSQHLRVPSLSRAQGVYNVQIALSALSELPDKGPELEDINAENIVDGHREKTLRLLWCLMGLRGMAYLVDFHLVDKEIKRLDCQWMTQPRAGRESADLPHDDEHAEPPYLTANQRHEALLKSWAVKIGRKHGLAINNLSTSFSDGLAYTAIVGEYASFQSVERRTKVITGDKNNETRLNDLVEILKTMGCSQAFVDLFRNSTIPTSKTTTLLLAFLASRLLPPAERPIAAKTIQAAWRRSQARFSLRQRTKLAWLARDCAAVVQQRQKELWAARVIQRKWKEVCWR
ncbi:MAG: hypothetical protein M1828_005135 [Chrysothrix sp. TS-e1954]|nr:MAG: hypothetical protein M1828_005135 [Chrysothrix sp. TS-e1954]